MSSKLTNRSFRLTPQSQMLWDYLKTHRSLTSLVAMTTLGVGSVSRRMTEIARDPGVHAFLQAGKYEIAKEWSKDGKGRRYIKYFLREL